MAREIRYKITLEKPARFARDGKTEMPLELVYGWEEASGYLPDMIDSTAPGNEQLLIAYAADAVMRKPEPKPGSPIKYELMASDPERSSIIVPVEAAVLWFGDIRKQEQGNAGSKGYEWTFGYEKERIALQWGYYRLPRLALNGKTACTKGDNDFDLAKIGVPKVPHVLCEHIDDRGKVTGKLQWRPWEHFHWEDDLIADHPELLQTTVSASDALGKFSVADIEAFLAFKRIQEAQTQTKGGATK